MEAFDAICVPNPENIRLSSIKHLGQDPGSSIQSQAKDPGSKILLSGSRELDPYFYILLYYRFPATQK